jgi:recombination protein RecA
MRAALSKADIESQLASRFGEDVLRLPDRGYSEIMATGLQEIDELVRGFPRGAITEIFGPESSGRTSLMLSALAHATNHEEVCALVDTSDVLDPKSAAGAEVDLERLLWIRCAGNLEHSFKAVDLLLQAGGFGLVVLDLGDIQTKEARRIISSWWYRFRRVVENTPTALVVIAQDSCVRSCASLKLSLDSKGFFWSTIKDLSPTHANVLQSNLIGVERRKPVHIRSCEVRFTA